MRAWIGLGANLGDGSDTLARAVSAIAALPHVRLQRVSSLYRSAPLHAEGPDFVNAVAELETTLGAQPLFEQLLAIETAFGRRRPYRNAPRTLDLDFLLASDDRGPMRLETPALTLPHPRMHGRAFVLAPLAEIDAKMAVPGHGSVDALLAACRGQHVERIGAPPVPGGSPVERS